MTRMPAAISMQSSGCEVISIQQLFVCNPVISRPVGVQKRREAFQQCVLICSVVVRVCMKQWVGLSFAGVISHVSCMSLDRLLCTVAQVVSAVDAVRPAEFVSCGAEEKRDLGFLL